MRKLIFAALATAVLVPASLFAGSASAQVAPFSKFQQLIDHDQITIAYVARGGRGGGARVHRASVRRPAGMHAGGYRGYRGHVARGGVYRGNMARAGVYRGNVARAGAYRGVATRSYAGRYYNGRYYNGRYYNRPYAAYGRPYYRGAYYGGYYRPYYGGSYYPYGYGAAAATGALIGGAIASQPVVTGSIGSNASAYCAQRYRSYNPATGTFTGYDGRQHSCP
ncbi:BA14K family protein [Microvirga lotononidis]|uniref:Lectin-like protein BA14k n=1 Tax=Microvirga lotononidis TaxID=864069 RepID=I4YZ43_9HYPH|nr:BA14K family protein [Microvirga lotononidis]EIM29235.1 BA14K-like protein [Microvirga lotononidis]WQO29070.1 BA14K family protein [Microvirga lotononidis]